MLNNISVLGASNDSILRISDIVDYTEAESKSKNPYISDLVLRTLDDRAMEIKIVFGRWFPAWQENVNAIMEFNKQIISHLPPKKIVS